MDCSSLSRISHGTFFMTAKNAIKVVMVHDTILAQPKAFTARKHERELLSVFEANHSSVSVTKPPSDTL